MLVADPLVGLAGTGVHTFVAADTFSGIMVQLPPCMDRLRVMAPGTVHVAALKEYGRADAGAVI